MIQLKKGMLLKIILSNGLNIDGLFLSETDTWLELQTLKASNLIRVRWSLVDAYKIILEPLEEEPQKIFTENNNDISFIKSRTNEEKFLNASNDNIKNIKFDRFGFPLPPTLGNEDSAYGEMPIFKKRHK